MIINIITWLWAHDWLFLMVYNFLQLKLTLLKLPEWAKNGLFITLPEVRQRIDWSIYVGFLRLLHGRAYVPSPTTDNHLNLKRMKANTL